MGRRPDHQFLHLVNPQVGLVSSQARSQPPRQLFSQRPCPAGSQVSSLHHLRVPIRRRSHQARQPRSRAPTPRNGRVFGQRLLHLSILRLFLQASRMPYRPCSLQSSQLSSLPMFQLDNQARCPVVSRVFSRLHSRSPAPLLSHQKVHRCSRVFSRRESQRRSRARRRLADPAVNRLSFQVARRRASPA